MGISADQVQSSPAPWVVLVVDDEPDVHRVTQLVLGSFTYDGRGIELLSAYSGDEGYSIMEQRKGIALVLLDVVMETDDAGLQLARRIRDDLHNEATRIILRTGQPGCAPESEVMIAYDINDYRCKTDLTSNRLRTTIISGLRAFSDISDVHERELAAYSTLQQNYDLNRALIDAIPCPIFAIDGLKVLVECNQLFCEYSNICRAEAIGHAGSLRLPDALMACFNSDERRALPEQLLHVWGKTWTLRIVSANDAAAEWIGVLIATEDAASSG